MNKNGKVGLWIIIVMFAVIMIFLPKMLPLGTALMGINAPLFVARNNSDGSIDYLVFLEGTTSISSNADSTSKANINTCLKGGCAESFCFYEYAGICRVSTQLLKSDGSLDNVVPTTITWSKQTPTTKDAYCSQPTSARHSQLGFVVDCGTTTLSPVTEQPSSELATASFEEAKTSFTQVVQTFWSWLKDLIGL